VSSPQRPQAVLPRIDVGHQLSFKTRLNLNLNDEESVGTRGTTRARSGSG